MQYRTLGRGHGQAGLRVSAICLGVLPFGTAVDETTAFAILDRFTAAGGTFVDTSNNYAFWVAGGTGDESETVLGRWLASRGARDDVVIATKVGARPTQPGLGLEAAEGLSAKVIRAGAEGSMRRLRTDRLDVYYAHIEDRSVSLEETVGAFAELVTDGTVQVPGVSNHATWRIERARQIARHHGWPGYTCVQERYSYIWPRPGARLPERSHVHMSPELLDYARAEPGLSLLAYSSLLSGSYTRADRPLPEHYDHPGTHARLAVLREVAAELGATHNQVVLAWLIGGNPPILPIVGASSASQLDESLAAADLVLDAEQRRRLDTPT
jgi:aryl-alcohol dehydrogenase-like predicted oxidoreductase